MGILIIAIGGGIGALARFFVIQFMNKINYSSYYATSIVNLLGSLLIGFLFHKLNDQHIFHLFLTTGFLGGFTTYSTFSFETIKLFQIKQYNKAITYIIVNLVGGLLMFVCGYLL